MTVSPPPTKSEALRPSADVSAPPVPSPRPVPELTPAAGSWSAASSEGTSSVPDATGVVPVARWAASTLALVAVVVAVTTAVAYEVTLRSGALVHNKMLPWILGRSLGVASYLTLTALVVLGIWLRHPWRNRLWSPRPESLLRAHVVLAACTVVLLAGHLTSIALDHYAGVGWTGTFVPWQAHYRPTAVAIGTIALYCIVLVAGTAALAGSLGGRVWYPIHTVSAMIFCLCLAHGAMAGSDSHTLRWVYVITGGVVAAVQTTRWVARRVGRHVALELE